MNKLRSVSASTLIHYGLNKQDSTSSEPIWEGELTELQMDSIVFKEGFVPVLISELQSAQNQTKESDATFYENEIGK